MSQLARTCVCLFVAATLSRNVVLAQSTRRSFDEEVSSLFLSKSLSTILYLFLFCSFVIAVCLSILESYLSPTGGPGTYGPADGGIGDINESAYPRKSTYRGYRRGSNHSFFTAASNYNGSFPQSTAKVPFWKRLNQWTPSAAEFIMLLQGFIIPGILMGQRAPVFYRLYIACMSWSLFIVPVNRIISLAQAFRIGFNIPVLQRSVGLVMNVAVAEPGPVIWSTDWLFVTLIGFFGCLVVLQLVLLIGKIIAIVGAKIMGSNSTSAETNQLYWRHYAAGNFLLLSMAFYPLLLSAFFQLSVPLDQSNNPLWIKVTAGVVACLVIFSVLSILSILSQKSLVYTHQLFELFRLASIAKNQRPDIWAPQHNEQVPPLPGTTKIPETNIPPPEIVNALVTVTVLNPRNDLIFSPFTHNLSPLGIDFLCNSYSRRFAISAIVAALPFCIQPTPVFSTASVLDISTGGINSPGLPTGMSSAVSGSFIASLALGVLELVFGVYAVTVEPKPWNGVSRWFVELIVQIVNFIGAVVSCLVVILRDSGIGGGDFICFVLMCIQMLVILSFALRMVIRFGQVVVTRRVALEKK